MKFNRVSITNFRSIAQLTVCPTHSCSIFVGINESGKSNILKALATLNRQYTATKKDCRMPTRDEKLIDSAYIRFIFDIDDYDRKYISKYFSKSIIGNVNDDILIDNSGDGLSFSEFIKSVKESLYHVSVLYETSYSSYWELGGKYKISSDWVKLKKDVTGSVSIVDKEGVDHIANDKLVNLKYFDELDVSDFEKATLEDFTKSYGKAINQNTSEELPNVIFWEFSDKNTLPSQVGLAEFIEDPSVCKPLESMFNLYGLSGKKIGEEISRAKDSSAQGLRNLLDSIADRTTKHFKSVWKEYDIQFDLTANETYLLPAIKDSSNHYEFGQRSDGFRRFATFLLLVSIKVEIDALSGAFLVIDEPDNSLHPSGIRFLRDELIKISKKNFVFISTHSIFMIDSKNIDRHYIVKKSSEKTNIEQTTKSNLIEEEVVYNALGYSVYENIKQKNIIFEGWKDKKLFMTALKRVPKKYADIKNTLKEIGVCHAKGAKSFLNITPLIELANRECIILSDSDRPAKEHQTRFLERDGYGTWLRYDEIDSDTLAITGEDYVKPKAFKAAFSKFQSDYPFIKDFSTDDLINRGFRLNIIKSWMKRQKVEDENIEFVLNKTKDILFDELKPGDIEESYYVLLLKLHKMIVS